jgi:iron complex outermembrane receptor protein
MFKQQPIAAAIAVAFSVSGGLLAAPAVAQDAAQKLERVEITGSAIKRIEGETALPVTVITKQDIEKLGVTDAAELIQKIAANNGQGYALGNALGDAARPGFSGASLRGLGSNNTLILLNGRRMAVYAFDGGAVNLQSVPFAAIERVEILRDGASAIYGSDAVGGVINFITRKDFRGVVAKAGIADPTSRGDGKSQSASIAAGYGDLGKDRFNVFGVFAYKKDNSLKASDRDFSKTAFRRDIEQDPDASGTGSPFFNRLSSNAFPGNILINGALFRNPYAAAFQGATPGIPTDPTKGIYPDKGCLPPVSYDTTSSGTRCRYDYASQIDIIPTNETFSFLGRANVQLSTDHTLFVEASYARQKSIFRISQTPASEATTKTQADGTTLPLLYPASGKYYPGKGIVPAIPGFLDLSGDLNIYYRTLELGPRTNSPKTDESRYLIGLQGLVAGWDYNVGVYQATSKAVESYLGGYVLESKLLPAFYTGTINPFGFQDAAGLALLQSTQIIGDVRNSKLDRTAIDGTISKEIMNLPAGPVGLALGAQFYKDKYRDSPSPILGSSDIIGGAGEQPPVPGDRNVSGFFAEFNVPIIKNLDAQLALRHDRYSDVGNSTVPKVAMRWQPTKEFLMRASAGKGFRAPTLPDVISPPARTNAGGAYNDPFYEAQVGPCTDADGNPTEFFNPKYCNAQLSVINSGNRSLKAEKSKQWTLGFLFEPANTVSFGMDFWWINQTDLLGFPGGDNILVECINNFNAATLSCDGPLARFTRTRLANGVKVIDAAFNQITNLANQNSSGVDFSLKLRSPRSGIGLFTLNMDSTYIAKQVQKNTNVPGQDWTNVLGTYLLFGPVPRYKSISTLGWELGPWNASLTYNFQSAYEDSFPKADGSKKVVSDYDTFDLYARWTGIKNLVISGGVRNLFDRDPPKTNQGSYFQVGFDPTYVDPRGRTPYINVEYKFF